MTGYSATSRPLPRLSFSSSLLFPNSRSHYYRNVIRLHAYAFNNLLKLFTLFIYNHESLYLA